MSKLIRLFICSKILISEVSAVIYYLCACLKELGNDLCGYSVRECCDDKIGILGNFFVGKIFADYVNDASEFGIDLRIGLACECLACKMSESEETEKVS